ncbi:MAG: hypothetical protein ACOC9X_04175 [bacterium]
MPTNPLADLIPPSFLISLAMAADRGKLCLTFVVGTEQLATLNRGEAAAVQLEDGGVIVMVPETALRKAYADEEDSHAD